MHRHQLRLLLACLLALLAAALPVAVMAQGTEDTPSNGFVLRVDGPVTIPAGETIGGAVAISDNATVDGTVDGLLLVIDGTATVNGRVEGDVAVVRGTLVLHSGATVKNITLIDSDLTRATGATVLGDINRSTGFSLGWGAAIFSMLFWLGSTIALLLVGLALAAFAGKQVNGAGQLMTGQVGETVVSTLVVWIALPIVAVLAFFTLVGIPVGFAIGLFLLGLGFFGYVIAATGVGALITERGRPEPRTHPYLAAVVGLILLQIVAAIPGIGGALVFLAGLYGGGAIALYAVRAWRQGGAPAEGGTVSRMTPVPAA